MKTKKDKTKKIVITDALRKGLFSILIYGNYESTGEIADRVISSYPSADYPSVDRQKIVEAIEDGLEFIRQLAIGGKTKNPFEGGF